MWGTHACSFKICQCRCFFLTAHRCHQTNSDPAAVCVLSAVSKTLCVPDQQACEDWIGAISAFLSSAVCSSFCVPALIIFGFGVSHTRQRASSQPTQTLYTYSYFTQKHTHPHTLMKLIILHSHSSLFFHLMCSYTFMKIHVGSDMYVPCQKEIISLC